MAVDWTPIFENLKEELKKIEERDRKCDMERLTERTALGICGNNERVEHYPLYNIENDEHMAFGLINQCFEKLAEYEQAEEDGLLIRLPCKVGDTLYTFNLIKDEVIEFRAESEGFIVDILKYGLLGRTTFLTKAEAEQALAKMKGE